MYICIDPKKDADAVFILSQETQSGVPEKNCINIIIYVMEFLLKTKVLKLQTLI